MILSCWIWRIHINVTSIRGESWRVAKVWLPMTGRENCLCIAGTFNCNNHHLWWHLPIFRVRAQVVQVVRIESIADVMLVEANFWVGPGPITLSPSPSESPIKELFIISVKSIASFLHFNNITTCIVNTAANHIWGRIDMTNSWKKGRNNSS